MRLIKRVFKWLGILLLIVVVSGFIPAASGMYGLYWKRYATSLMGNPLNPGFSWYDPLEQVAGDYRTPLVVASSGSIPADVLDNAANYAEEHDSTALVVAHAGQIVFERNWQDNAPDSLFPTHSMTKVLPAMLIGHAIEDGFIGSADDPVATYVSEWDTPAKRRVTLRHLLNMASGIEESYNFSPRSLRMQRTMGMDITSANLAVEVSGEPGTVFAHFNPNSQLLGVILERATGRRYSDYLSEKIWRPMGAHEAFVFVDRPGGMAHSDCCMWSAIRDWIRVGEVLRNGGTFDGRQIVPATWLAEMIKPSQANPNYGMQLWLGTAYEEYRRYDPRTATFANYHSEPFAAADLIYLDGLGKKRLYVIPSRALVILRTGPNSPDWDDAYLPNLLTAAVAIEEPI